jgi:hypothetical protein
MPVIRIRVSDVFATVPLVPDGWCVSSSKKVTPGFVISNSHEPTFDEAVDGGARFLSFACTGTGVWIVGGVPPYVGCASSVRLYALPVAGEGLAAIADGGNDANTVNSNSHANLQITFIGNPSGSNSMEPSIPSERWQRLVPGSQGEGQPM